VYLSTNKQTNQPTIKADRQSNHSTLLHMHILGNNMGFNCAWFPQCSCSVTKN